MALLRLAVLVLAVLAGQHTATTHGFTHVLFHNLSLGAAVPQAQSTDGDPLDAELHPCALCLAFNGSHGAPPTENVDSFSSAPSASVVRFAVAPAPTFSSVRAFEPRAPPALPV